MVKTVAGFTEGGNLKLDNGWTVAADAGHYRHGFVETSFGSQGRTVDRVILGMSAASTGATNQEQLYVSASRAKDWVRLYTDNKAEIREAVQRSSQKLAALDLVGLPKNRNPSRRTGSGCGSISSGCVSGRCTTARGRPGSGAAMVSRCRPGCRRLPLRGRRRRTGRT